MVLAKSRKDDKSDRMKHSKIEDSLKNLDYENLSASDKISHVKKWGMTGMKILGNNFFKFFSEGFRL